MEVGQHGVDHPEFEAFFGIWIDEEVGRRRAGDDGSCAEADCVFEGSNRCGADRDDPPRRAESLVYGGGGAGGDRIWFGMKFVILDAVDADGLKGSEADMEGDFGGLDSALADAIEGFRGEMKAGGRGCYRSALLCVDGLIAFAIAGGIRARDVGRERDVADAIEGGEESVHALNGLKADAALAEFGAGQDLGLKFFEIAIVLAEEQSLADAYFAAGANQAFPIVGIGGELAGQKNLDAAVEEIAGGRIVRADRVSAGAFAAAIEPGGKDAGVVEDHKIAGLQQVREIAEQAVGITAAGSLQMQHAGTVAGGERLLGNEFVGKVEVEVRNQHDVRL